MGGRGVNAANNNSQLSFSDHSLRLDVEKIRSANEIARAKFREETENSSASGVGRTNSRRRTAPLKKCACCRKYTLFAYSHYEKCPICGWIDDPLQNQNIYFEEGKNPICLVLARKLWQEKCGGNTDCKP